MPEYRVGYFVRQNFESVEQIVEWRCCETDKRRKGLSQNNEAVPFLFLEKKGIKKSSEELSNW